MVKLGENQMTKMKFETPDLTSENIEKIAALFSGGHHQISKIDPKRQLAYGLLRDGTQ